MIKTSSVFGLAMAAAFLAMPANASPVNGTLSATYFEVPVTGDPDFGANNTPSVAAGSSLGVNGFPVATPGSVNDIGVGNQITWWSPTLNNNVSQTGTGTVTLPYSSNMFAPNSTGSDDSSFFETAIFKGLFNLGSAQTVTFSVGSDDDSFIYVNGTLIGQNPGVHGVTNVSFDAPGNAGSNSIEVFYADRHQVGAFLSLSLDSSGIVITTDPAPGPIPGAGLLSYLALGLMGLGSLGWKRLRAGAA
jgi:hypothetical protein